MQPAVELSWAPRDGAVRYRVQILSADRAEPLQVHVVDATQVTLADHDLLPDGARWQVHSSCDGASWELHVPPVALVAGDDDPASQLEWEPSTAAAYRVIVSDEISGQTVLKQVTAEPSARISWAGLSARHPHSQRIQELRDGEWSNLHPYGPLLPPPELALGPVAEEPAGASLAHLVLVHLCGLPPGGLYGERRPPQWWEQRLQLLRKWTIPALTAANECDGWLLVCDSEIAGPDLEALLTAHPQAIVSSELCEASARGALRDGAHAADVLAVTQLIAGDRPRPDLGRYVRARAGDLLTNVGDRSLISFPLAVRLDRERDRAHIDLLSAAPAHTAFVSSSTPLDDVLRGPLPFVDTSYRRIDDTTIAAVLRAWPGPNALSSLHGQRIASVVAERVRAAFGLDDEGPRTDGRMAAQAHA